MSTFNGIVKEFPRIQIDNFRLYENHPPPLACFLSHIHSDHLTNLDIINSPFVYCTAPTRELLLKLERYPHRMNFVKGILEARKQTYRKVKRLLKPIPLETPTTIELTHGYTIQATLFDANHCTGACMFLIEGDGKAILYTGDIRSEPWWVNSLVRNPVMIPYAKGPKRLDNIYLDTTFAMGSALKMDFTTKADGIAELLAKAAKYPPDTIFYLHAWTFGYEEVWIALSKALKTRVHLCDYRYRVYSSMRNVPDCFNPHTTALLGFQLGNSYHEGCLTKESEGVRLHSCERGTHCDVFKNQSTVIITPIITRHEGRDVAEVGAGGGQGDLDQRHELELNDVMAVAQLISMCGDQLRAQPALYHEIAEWLGGLMKSGQSAAKLDFEGFWEELKGNNDVQDLLDDIPLDRLVPAIAKLFTPKLEGDKVLDEETPRSIRFPFSRHSSYNELRCLVEAFRPKDIYPCTVSSSTWSSEVSMKTLFGDLCSADIFTHDARMYELRKDVAVDNGGDFTQESVVSQYTTPSQKRKTSNHRRSSDASTDSLASVKRTRMAPSSPTKRLQTMAVGSVNLQPLRGESVGNESSNVWSAPAISTPRNATSPSLESVRDRVSHRIGVAKGVQHGTPWRGLQSVHGYHNESSEEEL